MRERMLGRVRTALGRNPQQPPPPILPPRIRIPEMPLRKRIDNLLERVAALAGKTHEAVSKSDACDYVARITAGKTAVASNAPFLAECGITALPNVTSGVRDREQLRELCASANYGITSATYALAETGSLVMIASEEEPRLVSLLPPAHIAIVPRERILTGLDELLSLVPQPAERNSSMVLITGPSRTADIEQILVRGVHGPGEIHIVVV